MQCSFKLDLPSSLPVLLGDRKQQKVLMIEKSSWMPLEPNLLSLEYNLIFYGKFNEIPLIAL